MNVFNLNTSLPITNFFHIFWMRERLASDMYNFEFGWSEYHTL